MGTYDFSAKDKREELELDSEFKPLPDGDYLMSIDYAEILDTKSGLGEHLKLELVVLDSPDGSGQNRRVFEYHMIKHDNPTTQEIGRGEIAQLAEAIGLPLPLNIQDTSQFLNKAVRCRLYTEKGTDGYKDKNKVKKYMDYSNSPAQSTQVLTPPPVTTTEPIKDDIPF